MGDVGAECYHFAPTFLELWGDCLGYLLGGVGVDVIHAFLDGVGEFLDDFRILFNIALSGAVGRIWHIT